MGQEDRTTGLVGFSGMKVPVRLATTANLTLSGEQTIDGVAAVTGDRVLVKDQTTQTQNGIYVVDTGDWNRAADCDGSYDLVQGSVVYVNAGSTNTGFWYCTSANPVDIESDNITWARASSVLAAVSAYMQTLLDDTTAAAARTTLGLGSMAVEANPLNTDGDFLVRSGGALARLDATESVTAHATTANPWVARAVVLTGSAVTFTDIADAPYAGAVVWVKQNAAHVWTDGATFDVQGNANYTAAAGDWIRIYATTVSTFEITIFKANGAAVVPITLGTEQATTSGTSIDFTGIPAGTKRITVMLDGVSTNGNDQVMIQIGDSGGVETSGYTGSTGVITGGAVGQAALSAGFNIPVSSGTTHVRYGTLTLELEDAASNTWVATGMFANTTSVEVTFVSGLKALSAELDRVRLTTTGGVNTFDAGAVNISYSG